jgi:hypothetical protein
MMNELQQRRMGENEARLRALNEHIRGAVDGLSHGRPPTRYSIMCECAIEACHEMIEIEPERYLQVRANPTHFVVRPEHVVPEVEFAIERRAEWWIIEKVGAAAAVARNEAP